MNKKELMELVTIKCDLNHELLYKEKKYNYCHNCGRNIQPNMLEFFKNEKRINKLSKNLQITKKSI